MAENKYQFERLTLKDDVNLDVYEDAINYVFDNPDVKNVAITGAYSAGKSSVLASYKKKHNNLKFLHISLAHFKSPEHENETDVKESVLEGKILNQLIHQIPSSKIPQTNFRVKRKVSTIGVVKQMLEVVLLFVAIIYFARFDVWKNYVYTLPDNWFKFVLSLSTHQYALMVDAAQNITRIIIDPEPVSEKLKNDLIRSNMLNRNEKIDLFIAMIPHLDEDSLKETLKLLELNEFLKIFDAHKRPKFAINEENEKLLSAFKSNDLIADYEVSEKEGYYKVIRVKQAIIRCPR